MSAEAVKLRDVANRIIEAGHVGAVFLNAGDDGCIGYVDIRVYRPKGDSARFDEAVSDVGGDKDET